MSFSSSRKGTFGVFFSPNDNGRLGEPEVILFYCIFSVSVSIGDAWFNHSELDSAENICIVLFWKMSEPELTLIKLDYVWKACLVT